MKKTVFVIGGGASGLVAAIQAARCGLDVTILEHRDKIGKKILMTGNGKCNLTNLQMDSSHYVTSDNYDKSFIEKIISTISPSDLLDFFSSIGVRTTVLRNGYVYPETEAAATIVSALYRELKKLNIKILLEQHVKDIQIHNQVLNVVTEEHIYYPNKVIIACGGKSYPKTGSDGSGIQLLSKLHVLYAKNYPALTAFICKNSGQKILSGFRSNAKITLTCASTNVKEEFGQIQFTDYGISGIPVFQVSSYVQPYINIYPSIKLSDFIAYIDFFPDLTKTELQSALEKQICAYSIFDTEEALTGFIHKKIIQYLLKKYNLSGVLAKNINKKQLIDIVTELKSMAFPLTDLKGYDFCQVTGGGILFNQLNQDFSLKKYPDIYVIGELLNTTGDCGGYNLHLAFSGGLIAGKACASDMPKHKS